MKTTVPMLDSRPAPLVALGLAVLAAITLASCSQDSRVLARVGSKTITAGEFTAVAQNSSSQYPFLPDSAKRLLLDDMIRRALMLQEAEQRGFTKDTAMRALRETAEQDVLLGALTNQVAPQGTPISEAELAAFYEWFKTEHNLQVIYTSSPRAADIAMARLRAGEPFDRVARQFNSGGAVPPDGMLGFIPGGTMLEPLDTRMREARIGEVFGPVKVGTDSWFIARVLERRAKKIPERATIEDQLRQQLLQRKHSAQILRVITSLRAEYRYQPEPGGAQELFARANRPAGSESTEAVAAPDAQIVLARYRGPAGERTYSMADANRDLQATGAGPDYSSVPAIQRWIESHVMRILVIQEAKRRHLDQEPANARHIQDRLDGAVLQSLYNQEISARVQVDDAELEAEYRRRTQGTSMPPWEQAPVGIREQLRSSLSDLRREELLRQFTGSLRTRFPVTIDESLLQRLEWPLPGMQAPQG